MLSVSANHRTVRGDQGFSLIEVLVTFVVMAIGLLGLAALQVVALKNNRTALHHSYATFYAADILDAMRANPRAALGLAYNLNWDTPATGGTIAGADMIAWKSALTRDLPSGQGKVTVQANGGALIQIRWKEGYSRDQPDAYTTFSTQTSL